MNAENNVWEFYEDKAGRWRWRAFAKNKLELACSSQGYINKRDAEICARRFGWNDDSLTLRKTEADDD